MKIEFAAGEAGVHEAREIKSLVHYVVANTVSGSHDRQLLQYLDQVASEWLERPEAAPRTPTEEEVEDRPWPRRLRDWWREYFGPSRREVELAQQRVEALARAERAERSAFDALAEMARVGAERDQALKRLRELESRPAS
jgi:hypothetical protein